MRPGTGTVFWFACFWVLLPAKAYADYGWPGVVGLLVAYAGAVVVLRWWFGRRRAKAAVGS